MLVVEHDEDTIRAADYVIDMGPRAGVHGGRIVAAGTPEDITGNSHSLTGAYLSGRRADRGAAATAASRATGHDRQATRAGTTCANVTVALPDRRARPA